MNSAPSLQPSDRDSSPGGFTVGVGLRLVAPVAILVGGLVHLELYFRGGYRSFPNANLGRSFLINGVASVLVAAALMIRRDVIVRLAGIAVSVGTLIAFYLTRQTDKGIFGFTEKGLEPSPQAALALIAELIAVVVLVASFVPPLDWKAGSVINPTVAGALAVVVVAVGILGSVAWARDDSTRAVEPSTTSVATPPDGSTSAPTGGAGSQEIGIKDFSFAPASVSINVGDSVTWTNGDSAAHSIQSGDHTFDSPDKIDEANSFSFTFTAAGTFAYICGIHQYMKGTVVVAG
jgi:plastocyanin